MLIKEYRIPLPLTVEEYRIAQLYMIQVTHPVNQYLSLIPKPFEGKRKGLVHTVCLCCIFLVNIENKDIIIVVYCPNNQQ